MKLKETIRLTGEPFTKPLPIPGDILSEIFAKNGLKFENLGRTLILNEVFSIDRLPKVKKVINDNNITLKVNHSMWTEYEKKDYEKNPLWMLLFPEIWIDDTDFQKVCKICKKSTVVVNLEKKIPSVKSKKPIITINGQFTIVKKELKEKMETKLSGVRFEPFDEKGEYFHLLAKSDLGELVNPSEDFLEYDGICQVCNLPNYKTFFGAFKYSKAKWNGDDIVSGGFHEGVFFTEKVYNLIKSVEKDVSRYGVAVLI